MAELNVMTDAVKIGIRWSSHKRLECETVSGMLLGNTGWRRGKEPLTRSKTETSAQSGSVETMWHINMSWADKKVFPIHNGSLKRTSIMLQRLKWAILRTQVGCMMYVEEEKKRAGKGNSWRMRSAILASDQFLRLPESTIHRRHDNMRERQRITQCDDELTRLAMETNEQSIDH